MSSRIEKENLVRILGDKPQLEETPFWCRYGLHRWQKWSDPYQKSIYIKQSRHCDTCNIFEERKIVE
jgi:hypothetical protein